MLVQDDLNFNKGTVEGEGMLSRSIERFGVGRGVVVDKDNRIVAGNKTVASAIKNGIKRIRVVETEGDQLVAVKRTDVDIDTKKGREFALADNVVGNVNFEIDMDNVREAMERVELHPEIWDVDVPAEKTMRRFEQGSVKGESLNIFCFNIYKITMSDGEARVLKGLAKTYKKEHGSMNGFIGDLISKYNERNK